MLKISKADAEDRGLMTCSVLPFLCLCVWTHLGAVSVCVSGRGGVHTTQGEWNAVRSPGPLREMPDMPEAARYCNCHLSPWSLSELLRPGPARLLRSPVVVVNVPSLRVHHLLPHISICGSACVGTCTARVLLGSRIVSTVVLRS
jgi:hypothetical protein